MHCGEKFLKAYSMLFVVCSYLNKEVDYVSIISQKINGFFLINCDYCKWKSTVQAGYTKKYTTLKKNTAKRLKMTLLVDFHGTFFENNVISFFAIILFL